MRGGLAQVSFQSGQAPLAVAADFILGAEEVTTWLATAATGARLVYGRGSCMIQGRTQAMLRQAADAGQVMLFQPRSDHPGKFDFLAIKRAGAPKLPASPRVQLVTDRAMAVIYRRLKSAALRGERCPTDQTFASLTGLNVPQVKWRVRKLVQLGKIQTRTVPGTDVALHRVVTIVSSGRETAGPACAIGGRK